MYALKKKQQTIQREHEYTPNHLNLRFLNIHPSTNARLSKQIIVSDKVDPGDDTRLLLLCNPHTQTSRVFGRDELERLAALALAAAPAALKRSGNYTKL